VFGKSNPGASGCRSRAKPSLRLRRAHIPDEGRRADGVATGKVMRSVLRLSNNKSPSSPFEGPLFVHNDDPLRGKPFSVSLSRRRHHSSNFVLSIMIRFILVHPT